MISAIEAASLKMLSFNRTLSNPITARDTPIILYREQKRELYEHCGE